MNIVEAAYDYYWKHVNTHEAVDMWRTTSFITLDYVNLIYYTRLQRILGSLTSSTSVMPQLLPSSCIFTERKLDPPRPMVSYATGYEPLAFSETISRGPFRDSSIIALPVQGPKQHCQQPDFLHACRNCCDITDSCVYPGGSGKDSGDGWRVNACDAGGWVVLGTQTCRCDSPYKIYYGSRHNWHMCITVHSSSIIYVQLGKSRQFSLVDIATNLTHRFSVLSGLSVISFVSAPANESNRRPWSRVSRKRWHQSTLENEYAHSKTVWPVAQTEALFLPEFPVGIEEKLKLIFLGEISRGAFGQVFHVRCATTNKEYAMKVLSKSQVCSLDAVSQVKQEVMIQHVCSHHPFVTPLVHYWQTRKLLLVMTEFVGYGELQQLWRSLGRLPENLVKIYLAQIALALGKVCSF
ncbi:uncharacterized protein LOC134764044 [Penaeus indicus]|uniref:uncharacterized protein LOC134764044 n=1 Tax=Penaeus indicus TaxID=29960 RepID=UPI00300D4D8C